MKAKDSHGFQPLCQEIGLLLRVLWVFHLWNLKFCILHIGFLCFLSGPTWSTVLSSTPLTQGTTTDCTHQQSFAIRCIQFCTQPGACPWWEFQSRREGDCELFPTVHFLSLFDFNLPWYFAPLPSGTPLSLICAVALFQLLDMCIWELVSVSFLWVMLWHFTVWRATFPRYCSFPFSWPDVTGAPTRRSG